MTDSKIGNLVRLESQERLDIPDAQALQTLVYQAIVDALGGLLGETGGVLGRPTFNVGSAPVIGIGSATFVGCKRVTGDPGHLQGIVVHYDPTSSVQTGATSINLIGPATSGSLVYLFWGRTMANSDEATRVKWENGGENPSSIPTRRSQRIVFGYSSSPTVPPSAGTDWFCFGRVTSWAGMVPTITVYSPWDIGAPASGSELTPNPYMGNFLRTISGDGSDSPSRSGIVAALTALASQVLMLQDSGWQINPLNWTPLTTGTINWGWNPPNGTGVRQLDERVTTLEDFRDDQPTLLAWGFVPANGAKTGGVFDGLNKYQAAYAADDKSGTGTYDIRIRSSSAPSAVQVTPQTTNNGFLAYSAGVQFVSANNYFVRVVTRDENDNPADRAFFVNIWGTPGPPV